MSWRDTEKTDSPQSRLAPAEPRLWLPSTQLEGRLAGFSSLTQSRACGMTASLATSHCISEEFLSASNERFAQPAELLCLVSP
eukprot:scaffold388957_cov40-Prasinocladus_malaysianus.AAC.1